MNEKGLFSEHENCQDQSSGPRHNMMNEEPQEAPNKQLNHT